MSSNKRTILVVDDDSAILGYLHKMLINIFSPQAEEIEILSVDSGKAAIEQIQKGLKIQLALVDYVLPDMTGLEVINELKQHNKDAHVVLMSGYDMNDQAQKIEALFMKKPFMLGDIKKALGMEV